MAEEYKEKRRRDLDRALERIATELVKDKHIDIHDGHIKYIEIDYVEYAIEIKERYDDPVEEL